VAHGEAAEPIVLVQFERSGFEEVSRDHLVEESARAIERAMGTIRTMGERVSVTVESLARRPAEVEVAFGVVLDAEAGALIAKAGASASINVTLKWDLREAADAG
jgi:hypothetical protein